MPQGVLQALRDGLETSLGGSAVGVGGVAFRTIIAYGFTLVLIRMGSRRFLAKASAFDVIVAIMLGSIMSRAITASGELVSNLIAGLVLVVLHGLLALLAFRTDWLGSIIKGRSIQLIKDGQVQSEAMRQAHITTEDLREALRLRTQTDPARVKCAYMERSGDISVIPQKREPQLWIVSAGEGVQTIRIELQ